MAIKKYKTIRILKQEWIGFREFPDILRAVKNRAKRDDLTVSQIMRRILRKYLLDDIKEINRVKS